MCSQLFRISSYWIWTGQACLVRKLSLTPNPCKVSYDCLIRFVKSANTNRLLTHHTLVSNLSTKWLTGQLPVTDFTAGWSKIENANVTFEHKSPYVRLYQACTGNLPRMIKDPFYIPNFSSICLFHNPDNTTFKAPLSRPSLGHQYRLYRGYHPL